MAKLKKVTTVVWKGSDGKRVKPGTPGATKQTIESKKWHIWDSVDGRVVRYPASHVWRVANKMLGDHEERKELGKAGMIDPYKAHHGRPISSHVGDFLEHLRHEGNSLCYRTAVEERLQRAWGQ